MTRASVYLRQALAQLPRLLSRGDREPWSQTYGCFDRTYWAWKFTDFPGARFQELAYALACLYHHAWPSNHFHGHSSILDWTRAAMTYWRSLQYSGAAPSTKPTLFEHSLAATAFTGFYVAEAFLLVREELPADEVTAMLRAFRRAGDWLLRNDETHGVLCNHLAAAAAALATIERITGDADYGVRCRHFLNRIHERQSPEGWYEEYGGADIGYQTHGTFYLARICSKPGTRFCLGALGGRSPSSSISSIPTARWAASTVAATQRSTFLPVLKSWRRYVPTLPPWPGSRGQR